MRVLQLIGGIYFAVSFCLLGIESEEAWPYFAVLANLALSAYVNIKIDKWVNNKKNK